jgi:hypothetical protein
MTQDQKDYISEVQQRVRQWDFSGSAYPMSDDPTGEVLMELACIAKDYKLQIVRKDGMIILKAGKRARPSNN